MQELRYPLNQQIFEAGTTLINFSKFKATSLDGKVKVRQIDKLEIACSCGKTYFANLKREKKRKHPWKCQSCTTTSDWQESEYKNALITGTRNMSTENKKKRSDLSRISMMKNWENPEYLQLVQESHRTEEFKTKMSNIVKNRMENDPDFERSVLKRLAKGIKGTPINYNGIWLKSTFEKRFITVLDSLEIIWQYEPNGFKLNTYFNKRYYPDFYLPELDLWVEIKGYWRNDSKEKFTAFVKENHEFNIILLYKKDLRNFEINQNIYEAGKENESWVNECKRFRN